MRDCRRRQRGCKTKVQYGDTKPDGVFSVFVCVSPDEVCVVVFTGRESALDRITALHAGAAAFFNKPFDSDAFLAAARAAFKTT
jgi:CheY-like chemotaxis protein